MEPGFEHDARLVALAAMLPPEVWQARVAEARAQEAVIVRVRALQDDEGMSETAALARVAPGLHRSTFRNQVSRYMRGGVAGLVDHRPPPPTKASKVKPEARAIICALRRVDPHIDVARIGQIVEQQTGIKLSESVIKRELKTAGLQRPRGGGSGRPEAPIKQVEEVLFGGAELLGIMDETLGYSRKMAEAIAEAARAVAASASKPEQPRAEPDGARDENGRFTAAYNELNRKGDAALGPAFRSVEEKRREVDLAERRLASEKLSTIQRKCQALLVLPYLTDNGKTVQVDDYRAHWGLAGACGTSYAGETLERFLRDAKYLGLSEALLDFHLDFWRRHEPVQAAGEAPAAFFLYVDASNKPLWTHHFTKAGKVSGNGRVMPCLEQVLVHTGTGTPIFWQTTSGHVSLVKQALPVIETVEKKVGTGWQVDRIVVIDGEGCAVGLMRALKKDDRDFITLIKPSRVPPLAEVRELSSFEPYRDGDEVADGFVTLRDKDGGSYDVRAVFVRRTRAGQLTVLATSVERAEMTPTAIATGYFRRWPAQELRFKTFNAATDFKRNAGYGKQQVTNVAVVTELEKLEARKTRLAKRIERQGEAVGAAAKDLKRARLALNAAKARRKRGDGLVEDELLAKKPDPIAVWNRVDAIKAERDRFPEAVAAVEKAESGLAAAKAKLAALEAEGPKLDARAAELESRRVIYRADVELDQIVSVYKLGFVLLCELVLRELFAGTRMTLATFMRQILHLPAKRYIQGTKDHLQLACPPNAEVREAVEAACERVNAMKLRRNGRVLHLSVEARAPDQKQRSRLMA